MTTTVLLLGALTVFTVGAAGQDTAASRKSKEPSTELRVPLSVAPAEAFARVTIGFGQAGLTIATATPQLITSQPTQAHNGILNGQTWVYVFQALIAPGDSGTSVVVLTGTVNDPNYQGPMHGGDARFKAGWKKMLAIQAALTPEL